MKFLWFVGIAITGFAMRAFLGASTEMWGLIWRSVLIGVVLFVIWITSSNLWITRYVGSAGPGAVVLVMIMNFVVFAFGIGAFFFLGASTLSVVTMCYVLVAAIGMALLD